MDPHPKMRHQQMDHRLGINSSSAKMVLQNISCSNEELSPFWLLIDKIFHLNDFKAPSHIANLEKSSLKKKIWNCFIILPFSPALTLYDFFSFPKWKIFLHGWSGATEKHMDWRNKKVPPGPFEKKMFVSFSSCFHGVKISKMKKFLL